MKTKVGIIGVSPDRGWAQTAHIPALKVLPAYEIAAVTSRHKLNDFTVYESVAELVQSPDVDLVVVAVKVPLHYEMISAAIAAGKNVFSEWPLGRNLQEAEALASLAATQGVKTYIGLQSRLVPAVRFIRDYIQQGNIGEVLSTSMIGSGIIYGDITLQANDYTVDAVNGAGMLNVVFANAVDALVSVLGEFTELSATTAVRRKTSRVPETGEEIPVGVPDQVAVTGVLQSGAVASVHFRGGTLPGTNLLWEINGTKGDIQITAPGGSLAVFEVAVKASKDGVMEPLPIPAGYSKLPLTPGSVVEVYQAIQDGQAPTFEDAVLRHRMIAAIERAAETGVKQSY